MPLRVRSANWQLWVGGSHQRLRPGTSALGQEADILVSAR
jgi:hypothetical protein